MALQVGRDLETSACAPLPLMHPFTFDVGLAMLCRQMNETGQRQDRVWVCSPPSCPWNAPEAKEPTRLGGRTRDDPWGEGAERILQNG